MAVGKPVVGISQYGYPPSYNPPYPGMDASIWLPTLHIQPISFWE